MGARKSLFVTLAMLVLAAGTACAEKMTLSESVTVALENNPAVHIAKENVRKADAIIEGAFSAARPKLTLEGTYQRLDKAPTATFGGTTTTLGSVDNRSADLTLAQPIDVFGVIKTGKQAAETGKSSYQYALDRQTNDTTLDVKAAFFGVLRTQKYLKVQEDTIAQLDAHLKDAQTNYAAGTIPKFDVLRAETQLANTRQLLISAQNEVELAKAMFNNVLGRPLDTPVDLEEPAMPGFIEVELAKCVETARGSRPEVMQADSLVALNGKLAKIAELSGKPKFNFRWANNWNFDTSVFNSRSSSWSAFLTSSMSIFDGGATKAAVKQAKSEVNNAKSVREQVMDGVTLDAQQSYLSLKESRERIQAAEKGLEQARESFRLAQVRYNGGVSTQLEVLDAQAALTLAETNYVNAIYDYQTALAALEHAVGGEVSFTKLTAASGQ